MDGADAVVETKEFLKQAKPLIARSERPGGGFE